MKNKIILILGTLVLLSIIAQADITHPTPQATFQSGADAQVVYDQLKGMTNSDGSLMFAGVTNATLQIRVEVINGDANSAGVTIVPKQ